MTTTLLILAAAAVLFAQGSIRADLVAISALMLLLLTGVLTPTEGLSGFSSPIVIMLVGVFIVGGAVFRTGLAKIISRKILVLAGNSETKLFILIMLVTSGIGAFVSNTGTVAVMLPIVVSLAAGAGSSPSRFLMPLAFASTLGGMLTLIGTTPNMIISGALVDAGYPALNFFSFLPIGVICVVLGTVALLFLSKWLVKAPDKKDHDASVSLSLSELADKYHLKQSECRARVLSGSPLSDKTLQELNLTNTVGVTIVEIRRKSHGSHLFDRAAQQIIPRPDTRLQVRDSFTFLCPEEGLAAFAEQYKLQLLDDSDPLSSPEHSYKFDEFGIAEVVILSSSKLVDRKVRESGLGESYGLRILGIQRKNDFMLQNISDIKIQAGDALLVQGAWEDIARLNEETHEWVVVGQPMEAASKEPLDHKAPVAAVIVVLMIAVMALNLLAPVVAVMLAAIALIFTGCFRNVEEAYKTIDWQSVVLVASMLPMSVALEKTGAAALASSLLIKAVGDLGPYALLALIYAATSLTTLLLSNTATGALCTPIALQAALNMQLSPYPFLFAVATAASLSLAVPFSTPPNVLVMAPGRYTFMDYVKIGGPLQIFFGFVMVFALPLLFPFTP